MIKVVFIKKNYSMQCTLFSNEYIPIQIGCNIDRLSSYGEKNYFINRKKMNKKKFKPATTTFKM